VINIFRQSGNIENKDISHYLCQYQVETEGNKAFKIKSINFVNEDIRRKLMANLETFNLSNLKEILNKHHYSKFNISKIYEDLISRQLVNGVEWKKKKEGEEKDEDLKIKLEKVVRDLPPSLIQMEKNVLYFPFLENFPAGDLLYKNANTSKLVIIQITTQGSDSKEIKYTALTSLFKILECNVEDVETLVLCPFPGNYSKNSRLSFSSPTKPNKLDQNSMKDYEIKMKDYENIKEHFKTRKEIWKIPDNFEAKGHSSK